ncbi:Uncharacterised protein [Vibrio cholerae]|nr:Uncharacterised protein [Vibrio cholerae]
MVKGIGLPLIAVDFSASAATRSKEVAQTPKSVKLGIDNFSSIILTHKMPSSTPAFLRPVRMRETIL